MCSFTGLTLGTTRTDKCVGYEIALQFESGWLAGDPQSSQVNDIPERRMISVARLCACDQTDGSTPASLKTDMARLTVEDCGCSRAEIAGGKTLHARAKRLNIVFFMNALLAGMRKTAASGGVPQGLTGYAILKRR